MILLDVLANGASILLIKVQHCVTHVEPLIPGISDRHSCGSTNFPALVFLGLIPFFFPSPSLGSLYTIVSQSSTAISEESCLEVHVEQSILCLSDDNHYNALKFEKILC